MVSIEQLNEWKSETQPCIECDNSAGLCAEDPYGIIRKEWDTRFGGSFRFSENNNDVGTGSSEITVSAILMWNVCFTDLPEGEGDFARDSLKKNMSRTTYLLDEIDAKLTGDVAANPTQCFRDWLDNKFKFPVDVTSIIGELEAFEAIEQLRQSSIRAGVKNGVRSVKSSRERSKARQALREDVAHTVCMEVEEFTEDYRNKFGGSREHACLYCHLNHPCHGCGGNFPVKKFVEANTEGSFTSTTKDGKVYSGRWGGRMGCEKTLVRQSGLHLCWPCACRSALYRRRSVDAHRTRIERIASMKAKNPTAKRTLNKIKDLEKALEAQPRPFHELIAKGGIYKGQVLQMQVKQGGTLMEEQIKGCDLPIKVEMVWKKKTATSR